MHGLGEGGRGGALLTAFKGVLILLVSLLTPDTAEAKVSAAALICSTNWKLVNSSAPSIIRPSSRRNVLAVPSVENDGVLKVITNWVIARICAG